MHSELEMMDIDWAAFIDIDEFLVMRKHRHVADFLEEYCEAGAVLLSWLVFGTSNNTEYERLLYQLQKDFSTSVQVN